MDRTPGTSDKPFFANLLARLKGMLRPVHRNGALQLVVLAQGAHTITPLMIAALHENWTIRFAPSPGDAMALLRKAPSVALVASMPTDDLFLAVAGAGGSGVLWKPLSAKQMLAAIDSARSLAGTAPHNAHDRQGDNAVRSLGDPNMLRCE
jgi:hypothetical protein